MIEFKKTFGADHSADFAIFKELLKEAEGSKQSIVLHTHICQVRDRYSCVDIPQKPVTLSNWWMQGGILYYKKGEFGYGCFSFDEIDSVTVVEPVKEIAA